MKRLYLKFPPEMGDGDSHTVVSVESVHVADVMRDWARYVAEPGDTVSVQLVELDEAEYERLAEI